MVLCSFRVAWVLWIKAQCDNAHKGVPGVVGANKEHDEAHLCYFIYNCRTVGYIFFALVPGKLIAA